MTSRHPVTFTLDVEDHREQAGDAPRHVPATYAVLEFLAERGIRGTFFVVGDVLEAEPALAGAIVAEGHELGVHSSSHHPLPSLNAEAFTTAMRDTTKRAEDVAQRPIAGFRAPMFSLVPSSRWATDALVDLGYSYSSSVLPIRHPLFGDPACPPSPFRWPNGLVELPCPVVRVRGVGLPFLAAIWLRNLPWPVARTGLAGIGGSPLLWSYAHPYDFDPGEPYRVLPEAGRVGSRLIWRRRAQMFACYDRLLAGRVAPPLVERLDEIRPITSAA
jgi:peptidoglycan/xylan/chitin deacetylase (PgdA/CDA1 family)